MKFETTEILADRPFPGPSLLNWARRVVTLPFLCLILMIGGFHTLLAMTVGDAADYRRNKETLRDVLVGWWRGFPR